MRALDLVSGLGRDFDGEGVKLPDELWMRGLLCEVRLGAIHRITGS